MAIDMEKIGNFLQGVGALMSDPEALAEFQRRLRVEGKRAALWWLEEQGFTPELTAKIRATLDKMDPES